MLIKKERNGALLTDVHCRSTIWLGLASVRLLLICHNVIIEFCCSAVGVAAWHVRRLQYGAVGAQASARRMILSADAHVCAFYFLSIQETSRIETAVRSSVLDSFVCQLTIPPPTIRCVTFNSTCRLQTADWCQRIPCSLLSFLLWNEWMNEWTWIFRGQETRETRRAKLLLILAFDYSRTYGRSVGRFELQLQRCWCWCLLLLDFRQRERKKVTRVDTRQTDLYLAQEWNGSRASGRVRRVAISNSFLY